MPKTECETWAHLSTKYIMGEIAEKIYRKLLNPVPVHVLCATIGQMDQNIGYLGL